MVQRDDALDNNLHFTVSSGKRKTECFCVFHIKIQKEGIVNSEFNQRLGVPRF